MNRSVLLQVALLFIFIFQAESSPAQDVTDEFPKGSVNWTKGILTAVGSGVPPSNVTNPAQARLLAERAAVSDARRNLLELAGEVRVDAASTVGELMSRKDVVLTRISGIVKGSVVIDRRYLDNGSVEVTVEMPITGAFLDVVVNEVKAPPSVTMPGKRSPSLPLKKVVPPPPPPPPVPAEPVKTPEPAREVKSPPVPAGVDVAGGNYTGLIIDARLVGVKPALMPTIYDERNNVIYSAANMKKDDAVKTGVVGYAKEVDAAMKHPRVTETPVVVAAVAMRGENRSDVVISDRDAAVITTTEPARSFLQKGRVMIVYK